MSKKPSNMKKRKTAGPGDIAEIVASISPAGSDIFYFPVRHHSPVCSYFLLQVFKQFDPDIVLIEGPVDGDDLVSDIAHDKTRPPVAIYTFFSDKKNSLGYNGTLTAKSDIPLRVTAWYPFAEYSPEYVAIKEATRSGKEVHFIDLPISEKLKFEKGVAEDKNFFVKYSQWSEQVLAETSYMDALVKKTGFRGFNEYWNHFFEVNAVTESLEKYIERIYTFAYTLRWFASQDKDYPPWKTIEQREKFMSSQIAYWSEEHPEKRILVVTGAMHAVGLPFMKSKKKKSAQPKQPTCSLSPFSYTRMSDLSGYIAGIPSPYYQQEIWNRLKEKQPIDEIFNSAALQILLELSKNLKDTNNLVSTADSINAYQMAINLAAFRSGKQVSHEDLQDAIISGYIKGEVETQGQEILKRAVKLLTGSKVGSVFSGKKNPLEEDFYEQAKDLRIPVEGTNKNVRLEIYKREQHRQKSHFLHQTVFLQLGFARLDKGPNYITKENMELLTEQWEVRWDERISARLLELSVYGSTVAECAQSLLQEKIGGAYHSLDEMLQFLIFSLQMGFFDVFEKLIKDLNARTGSGQNFADLVNALAAGVLLYSYRESLIPRQNHLIRNFIYLTYTSAISKLKDLVNLPEDQVAGCVMACRTLSEIALNAGIDLVSTELLVDTVERIVVSSVKIVPQIEGAFIGLLHSFNRIEEQEVVQRFNGRAFSNEDAQAAAEFLTGLFLLNKTILITSDHLLEAIHSSITDLPEDIFMEILPSLRKSFTAFIPRELDYLAFKISKITGLKPELELGTIDSVALGALQKLDERVNESISRDWGL
ncbi:MAG: DUF5682 family protein [Candidatus Odinarchaeota archaeon]